MPQISYPLPTRPYVPSPLSGRPALVLPSSDVPEDIYDGVIFLDDAQKRQKPFDWMAQGLTKARARSRHRRNTHQRASTHPPSHLPKIDESAELISPEDTLRETGLLQDKPRFAPHPQDLDDPPKLPPFEERRPWWIVTHNDLADVPQLGELARRPHLKKESNDQLRRQVLFRSAAHSRAERAQAALPVERIDRRPSQAEVARRHWSAPQPLPSNERPYGFF